MPTFILAIDGPAGAGKSSIASAVADRLGFTRVDTGAIYRALTLMTLEGAVETGPEVTQLLDAFDLKFEGRRVYIGDKDVTEAIRTPDVTRNVSRIAAMPEVRTRLLELQRRLGYASTDGTVMEGRDIGTVVFPDADAKIFLTASAEERARRRFLELQAAGQDMSMDAVLEDIQRRDNADANRSVAPLKQAPEATVVDTTSMTPEEVVDAIVSVVLKIRG